MLAVAGFALIFAASPAFAQENVRLRATIEKVDGPVYTVKNRDGVEWKLTVSDPPLFVAIKPATMADIKPGMVTSSDGQILAVKYKDGEKKLLVTPETVVVTYVPGSKDELKPGTKIFVSAAKKQPDGTLQTPRITYGRDGAGPAF
jgi:hypothetical protein